MFGRRGGGSQGNGSYVGEYTLPRVWLTSWRVRTLSGILRLSPRRSVLTLKVRIKQQRLAISGDKTFAGSVRPLGEEQLHPAATRGRVQYSHSTAACCHSGYLRVGGELPIHGREVDA